MQSTESPPESLASSQLSLSASTEHRIFPIGTAYSTAGLDPPVMVDVAGNFVPTDKPTITVQRMTKTMDADEVPPGWSPPSPVLTGIGKVVAIPDEKHIRVSVAVCDRSSAKKRTQDLILMRDVDHKQKN
ncbi:hypothetical protein V8E36_008021 [Tilletia maclaganii]